MASSVLLFPIQLLDAHYAAICVSSHIFWFHFSSLEIALFLTFHPSLTPLWWKPHHLFSAPIPVWPEVSPQHPGSCSAAPLPARRQALPPTAAAAAWSTTKAICLHVTKGGDTGSVAEALPLLSCSHHPGSLGSSRFTVLVQTTFVNPMNGVFPSFCKLLIFHEQKIDIFVCVSVHTRGQGQRRSDKMWRGKMLLWLKKRKKSSFFQLYFKMGCWSVSAPIFFVWLAGLLTVLPEPRTGNVLAVYKNSEERIWEYCLLKPKIIDHS